MNNSIYNDFDADLLIENEINELFRDNWAGLKNAWKKRKNNRGFSYNFKKGKQTYQRNHPWNLVNPATPHIGDSGNNPTPPQPQPPRPPRPQPQPPQPTPPQPQPPQPPQPHPRPQSSVTQSDTFYTYIVGDDNYVAKKVSDVDALNEYLSLLQSIQQEFNDAKQKNLFGDLNDKTRIIQFKDKQEIPLPQFISEFESLIQANITATNYRIQNFQQLRLNEGWNPKNLFYSKKNKFGLVQKSDDYGRGEWMVSLREKIGQLLDKKYISLYGKGSVIGYQSMIYILQRKTRFGAILFIPLAIGGLIAALMMFNHNGQTQQQPTQPEQPQQEVLAPNVDFNYGQADPLTSAEMADIARYCQAHPNSTVTYHIVGAHNSANATVNNSQIYQQRARIINAEFAKYGVRAQWDGDYSDNDANANSATVKFRLEPTQTNNGSMPTANVGWSQHVTPQNSVYLTEKRMNKIINKSINDFLKENLIL